MSRTSVRWGCEHVRPHKWCSCSNPKGTATSYICALFGPLYQLVSPGCGKASGSSERCTIDLVMEVGQLIQFSPKRSSLFQSMQSQLSCDTPSLKPLCPTRWTVQTSAIQSVITNYEVLCDTLCEINEGGRDEYAIKAGSISTYVLWIEALTSDFFLQQNNFPSVSKVKTRSCAGFKASIAVSTKAKK